jgi:hypothetical protein
MNEIIKKLDEIDEMLWQLIEMLPYNQLGLSVLSEISSVREKIRETKIQIDERIDPQ